MIGTTVMSTLVISGEVVHGDKRGRELGFPTANVRVAAGAVPAFGVYAGRLDGVPAAVSVGVRPTFGSGLEPLLEAHVLDFAGDLYGREVSVELLEFVRAERSFDDVGELVEQMHDDVRAVREVVAGYERDAAVRVAAAVEDLRRGRMVVLDGGDGAWRLMVAAEHADAAAINTMATAARGLVEVAITPQRCRQLGLDVQPGGRIGSSGRALTLSIEARRGVTTGISAEDRATTVATAIAPNASSADVVVPGHVFPVRAAERGVLDRVGYAEAAVDLARLGALLPAAVVCVLLDDAGEVADWAAVSAYAQRERLRTLTASDVLECRRAAVRADAEGGPAELGAFRVLAVRDGAGGGHVAYVQGEVEGRSDVGLRLVGPSDPDGPGGLAEALSAVDQAGPCVVLQLGAGAWGSGVDLVERSSLIARLLRGLGVRGVRSVGVDGALFRVADVNRGLAAA